MEVICHIVGITSLTKNKFQEDHNKKYILLHKIGSGSFGSIYKGQNQGLERINQN